MTVRMRRLAPRTYALASALPLLVACSAPLAPAAADSPEHDAADGASSAAFIVVERTVTADESAHGNAVARFVRMRAGSVDDGTLRMVGATLDLPALGTCAPAADLSVASDEAASDGPRAVELLDVGGLAIEANGVRTTLEPRALPDIVDLVTGVLYSTRATTLDPSGLPARASYALLSTGSARAAGVPAFSVSATAPGEPDDLRIEGQDARAPDGVVLAAGKPVDLAWSVPSLAPGGETSAADDAVDDVIYVEIVAPSGDVATSAANVRCLFADNGLASVPAAAFAIGHAALADETTPGDAELTRGTLVVHRVHREAFQVGGIDSGVLRFDFARAAEFSRH